ncbi:MAG: hypothetical protein K6A43_09240 [Treponema sp.]|nr:hypothetical protein [Treponema sp.]
MKKILCLCFSSTLQRTISFDSVRLEKVNRSKYYRMDASGKAVNSARILAQLEKGCVRTFCPLGTQNKDEFIQLADADGLNLFYVEIPGKTRECWTLLDRTAGTTTELVVGEPVLERTPDFVALEENLLTKILPAEIQNCDAVLLAGSRPGIWKETLYAEIAKLCFDHKKIFLADYIGADLKRTLETCTPSIIKINDEEFTQTFCTPQEEPDEESLKSAIIKKSQELHNMIVVTRGTNSTFAANDGTFVECPIEKVKAVNTTACGDSFNAGFLYEYLASGNFAKALAKGTWCAARNAERECPGTIL